MPEKSCSFEESQPAQPQTIIQSGEMSGCFLTPQPASSLSGMPRQTHSYSTTIHASESGLITIGNPYSQYSEPDIVQSQNSGLLIRGRATRVASNEAARAIREDADHVIKDLDYMQEALLTGGIMTNPKDHAISILRVMDQIGDKLKKAMKSVVKNVSTVQGLD